MKKTGYILTIFLISALIGCYDNLSIQSFLEMTPEAANLLSSSARSKLTNDIVKEATTEGEIELLSVDTNSIQNRSEQTVSLFKVNASSDLDLPEQVNPISFDFDPDWEDTPSIGLNGFSELELINEMIDNVSEHLNTIYANVLSNNTPIQVVRSEGAPFIAAYDIENGKIEVNPNYLRLLSNASKNSLSLPSASLSVCMNDCLLRRFESIEDFSYMLCTGLDLGTNLVCKMVIAPALAGILYSNLKPLLAVTCLPGAMLCAIF